MTLELEFLEMMDAVLQIEPCQGFNSHGEPIPGTPYEVPCRVSGKAIALRKGTTADKTPIFDVWAVTGGHYISLDDRITVIGADPRWTRQGRLVLFAVGQYTDDDGIHHTKLQCGWQYHRQGQ